MSVRRLAFIFLVSAAGVLAGCKAANDAATETYHVSATVQPGQVRLGGIVQVTLRATGNFSTPATAYHNWYPWWWQFWHMRSSGAALDPIAIPTQLQSAPSAHTKVWHVRFYIRKGNGKASLQFGLHTPQGARAVWTQPIIINILKTPGLTAKQAAGPLQVRIILHTYNPRANAPVHAELVVKNITHHPAVFWTMGCSWFTQWTYDSDAIGEKIWPCLANPIIRHVLAPGGSCHWTTTVWFARPLRGGIFRVGFTPLRPWPNPPAHWTARTYWSAPIHVTVSP